MRRRWGVWMALTGVVLPATAQDVEFVSLQKVAAGTTNRGVVGAVGTAGLLGSVNGDVRVGATYTDLIVGEFSGSGGLDLLAVDVDGRFGRLTLLPGAGDGTFAFPHVFTLSEAPQRDALIAGGVPVGQGGSGRIELLYANNSSVTGLSIDFPQFEDLVTARKGASVDLPWFLFIGDLHAAEAGRFFGTTPGIAVVFASSYFLVRLANGDTYEFFLPSGTVSAARSGTLAVGVVNRVHPDDASGTVDAHADVLVCEGSGEVRLFATLPVVPGPGSTFSDAGTLQEFAGGDIARIVDFNADGFPDVAVASTQGGSIDVALSRTDGPGYDLPVRSYLDVAPIVSVEIARLNDDAFADIVALVEESDGGSGLRLLLGDGTGTFALDRAITSSSGAAGLPLRNVRAIAVGRFDSRSTGDDVVVAVSPDDTTGSPGGLLYLSQAEGYDVVPVPVRTKAFHPCFELLAATLEDRDAALTGMLTPAQRKLKSALATARAALANPSDSLASDLVTASTVAKALAKAFSGDPDLIGQLTEALDCYLEEVRDGRDELSDLLDGVPSSKFRKRAAAALAKCDGLLAKAGTAANPASIAGLLSKALKSAGKGSKLLAKVPSYVTATNDGAPFASEDLDFSYGTGGSLSLFAWDHDPVDEANFAEINLNLNGIAGPGTYAIERFPGKNRAYIARNGPACGFDCPRWDAVTGTVTITSEDANARVVDGTFSFDAERISGTGVFTTYVYSGRFHLRY